MNKQSSLIAQKSFKKFMRKNYALKTIASFSMKDIVIRENVFLAGFFEGEKSGYVKAKKLIKKH